MLIEKLFHFFFIFSLAIPGKMRLNDSALHYGGAEFALVPFDIVFLFYCLYRILLMSFNNKKYLVSKDNYLSLFLIFIGLNILILPFSMSISYSIYEILRLCKLLIWVVFLRSFLISKENLYVIMYAFAFIVLIQFIFVVYQSITGIGLSGWRDAEVKQLNVVGDSVFRSSGTFGHPGILSQFIVVILPFLYMSFMSESQKKIYKNIMLICILMSFYIVVQTYARTGIIVTILLLIAILIPYIRERKNYLNKIFSFTFIISIMSVIFIIFYEDIFFRFNTVSSESGDIRLILNQIALDMIMDKPIVGVGLNAFTEILPYYDLNNIFTYLNYPVHNVYLLIMAETGIIVGSFFIFINIYVLISLGKSSLSYKYQFLSKDNYSYAVTLSILSILIFAILGWSWRLDSIQALYWFLIAFASNLRFNRFIS